MHIALVLTWLVLTACARADELDPSAIKATAKRMEITEQQVREAAGAGCESDMMSMNICAEYQFVVANIRMNDAYAKLTARHQNSKSGDLLLKAQRAWLAYRDAACQFESSGVEGGTLHAHSSLSCMREKTILRTAELTTYALCTQSGCPL